MKANLLEFGLSIAHQWRWLARIAIVWGVLSVLAPINIRVLMESPPRTVETVKSQVCVHTRLEDEVSEWSIQRSLQLTREMGAQTIVQFFPWAYAEGREHGDYNWSQFDKIVRHTQNQGIRIIARMGFVPDWARPEHTTFNALPEESFEAFADFVATFAKRYAGTVSHIIIWNEPNLAFEWGFAAPDPAYYASLLETVYPIVKAANPDITILAGALAPTLEPQGSPNGLNDLLYLEQLYQAGAADYFDALAIHTYGFTQPADAEPAAGQLNFRRAELLHDVMLRYDDPDKPVFITESGWNDSPRWTNAVRPSQRVANTIDAFAYAEENWGWLDELCIWALRYPRNTGRYPDNYTLMSPTFQLKPIYFAIQDYARGWEQDEALWLPAPDS
jgi:hypothetical protein